MVRKDPINIRGPEPPGGRPKPVEQGPTIPRPTTLFELRPEAEYHRLWEVVSALTAQNIATIQTLARLGVPGVPLTQLKEIRDRIDQIIKEARSNE